MTAVSLISVPFRACAAVTLGFAIALAALAWSRPSLRAQAAEPADQPDDRLPGPESALRDAARNRVVGPGFCAARST